MHAPTWENSLLKVIREQRAGLSPFDNSTQLQYVFMRFSDTRGTLVIWDEVNKKKGVLHGLDIPVGAKEMAPENDFLPDYELVY